MAFVLADKVREAVNAPGTSDFELLGPPPSVDTLTFASQIGDGNTTRYQAWGAEGWEIGIGTVSTGATNRLLRPGTVLVNSSGGTSLIDFQGPVQVACVFSTTDLPYVDESGDVPARGGRDLGTDADRWRNLWLSGHAQFDSAAFGLGNADLPVVDDADSLFGATQFARLLGSSANAPTSAPIWAVINLHRSSETNAQLAMLTGGATPVDVRVRAGRAALKTGWEKLYHTANILGTVSQSSGSPTGAIIERGDNANGQYIKMADGTQICTRGVTITPNPGQTFTMPASFLDEGAIDFVAAFGAAGFEQRPTSGSGYADRYANSITTTVAGIDGDTWEVAAGVTNILPGDWPAVGNYAAKLFAIGRWF